jgi:hypothetical protein
MEKVMVDRFDLEQSILNCWNVTSDINLLYENVMESNMSTDDIANALLGIESIYEMKFEKLFRQFEQLVHSKKIT